MYTIIKTFYVAGVSFRPADVIDALGESEKIRLIAEPDNKFDRNAVRIAALFVREQGDDGQPEESWEHIGYIPKTDTWLFHLLRGLNTPIKLRMDVNHSSEPHRKLLVTAAVDSDPELPFI